MRMFRKVTLGQESYREVGEKRDTGAQAHSELEPSDR